MWQIQLIVWLLYLTLQKYSPSVGSYKKELYSVKKCFADVSILSDSQRVHLEEALFCLSSGHPSTKHEFIPSFKDLLWHLCHVVLQRHLWMELFSVEIKDWESVAWTKIGPRYSNFFLELMPLKGVKVTVDSYIEACVWEKDWAQETESPKERESKRERLKPVVAVQDVGVLLLLHCPNSMDVCFKVPVWWK